MTQHDTREERLWAICQYVISHDPAACRKCPEWEEPPEGAGCDKAKRACRIKAEAVFNIVTTGNRTGQRT